MERKILSNGFRETINLLKSARNHQESCANTDAFVKKRFSGGTKGKNDLDDVLACSLGDGDRRKKDNNIETHSEKGAIMKKMLQKKLGAANDPKNFLSSSSFIFGHQRGLYKNA